MNEHGEAQHRRGIDRRDGPLRVTTDRRDGPRRVSTDRREGQRRVSTVPVALDRRSGIDRREGPPDRRKGTLGSGTERRESASARRGARVLRE